MTSSDLWQRTRSRYSCCGDKARTFAEEHPQDRQETQAQDGGEGQTLPLCEVPEAKPEAREDSRAVVLPAVSGPQGSGVRMKILYLHRWNTVVAS